MYIQHLFELSRYPKHAPHSPLYSVFCIPYCILTAIKILVFKGLALSSLVSPLSPSPSSIFISCIVSEHARFGNCTKHLLQSLLCNFVCMGVCDRKHFRPSFNRLCLARWLKIPLRPSLSSWYEMELLNFLSVLCNITSPSDSGLTDFTL